MACAKRCLHLRSMFTKKAGYSGNYPAEFPVWQLSPVHRTVGHVVFRYKDLNDRRDSYKCHLNVNCKKTPPSISFIPSLQSQKRHDMAVTYLSTRSVLNRPRSRPSIPIFFCFLVDTFPIVARVVACNCWKGLASKSS